VLELCAMKVACTVLQGGKLAKAYLSDFYFPLEFLSTGKIDTSMSAHHVLLLQKVKRVGLFVH
jgi:hypothetical protein